MPLDRSNSIHTAPQASSAIMHCCMHAECSSIALPLPHSLQENSTMSSVSPACTPGVDVLGRLSPGFAEILTQPALAFVAKLARQVRSRAGASCWRARTERQAEFDAGKLPDFLPETRAIREGDWTVAPVPARPAGPPRRNHRPDRPQDGHQRAQLRRERVHGGLRGLEHADVEQHDRGADQPARRGRPHDRRSRATTASTTA